MIIGFAKNRIYECKFVCDYASIDCTHYTSTYEGALATLKFLIRTGEYVCTLFNMLSANPVTKIIGNFCNNA